MAIHGAAGLIGRRTSIGGSRRAPRLDLPKRWRVQWGPIKTEMSHEEDDAVPTVSRGCTPWKTTPEVFAAYLKAQADGRAAQVRR